MAYKHPKHRRIPRTLLKIKALRHLENKLIGGMHVLEFAVVMILITASAVTTAFFFNFFGMHNMHHENVNNVLDKSPTTMEKELETNDVKETSNVESEAKTVDAVNKEDDEKQKDVKTNIER